jgi:hypothetical protein
MGFASLTSRRIPPILALDADLRSSTGLHIFEHFHPAKLVKAGIAEQNMVSMAAGLSQEGYIPFPCTFDAFSRRFLDQMYVTVAYSNLNVKFWRLFRLSTRPGHHQSDKELVILRILPGRRRASCIRDAPYPASRRDPSLLLASSGLRGRGQPPSATTSSGWTGVTVLTRVATCFGHRLHAPQPCSLRRSCGSWASGRDHHPSLA